MTKNVGSSNYEFSSEDVEWRLREAGLSTTPELMSELADLVNALPSGSVPIEEAVAEYSKFSKQAVASIASKMAVLESRLMRLERGNEF
ncbi:hypothetical protein HMPREF3155_11605 [Corynebacterium sp. HMSC06D04]|uniref:hypothetical protein n=1 Tax=unclassified Corynebacterium TaxID=2624378 RepID=UPI0008A55E24|nr:MULTISPECIES: hypothetical protein [unclassified Corynebacterium]OFQ44623.1 hypothetical protein HMPREF2935_07295 [Corynebacterium sp. HMSC076D02]OFT49521.1 hypothetical protein HMPREF3155_11605 [Corynebacterium sp. HMSC06D04]OHO69071.1 hypothetical protein HMPREF2692_12235 [Corynebacterium sp. HMSC036D03]